MYGVYNSWAVEHWIEYALLVIAGWFGAYFGAYMSKKAENRAVHEDIGKLVDQVKAVTAATEEIKASLSRDAWFRDLKKDTAFQMLTSIGNVSSVLTEIAR